MVTSASIPSGPFPFRRACCFSGMRKENPEKAFYPLEPAVLCPNMKRITLEDVLNSLRDMSPAVELEEEVLRRAREPIDRMLEVR